MNPVLSAYGALIKRGVIRADDKQAAVARRLALLFDELRDYKAGVDRYHARLATYHAESQQRFAEVKQRLQQEMARQQPQQPAGAQPPPSSGWRAWLPTWPTSSSQAAEGKGARGPPRVTDALVRRVVQQELGQPPPPPPAPKGLYVHGSVGTGKTMLMDLLWRQAEAHLQLPHLRRLHFNSAMLELHSRLHLLEKQRQAAAGATGAATGAATQPALGQSEAEEAEAEAAAEEEAGAGGEAEEGGAWAAAGYWSRMTAQQQQQRKSRLAVMAVRRHLRQAQRAQKDPGVLARSSSALVRAAARSFLRGQAGDPTSGWGAPTGTVAALLCFDEFQISDVWSASALKGVLQALVAEGCVVVATSNRAPHQLPRHGYHEDLFHHFLSQLTATCDIMELTSETDYRRLLAASVRLPPLAPSPPSPPPPSIPSPPTLPIPSSPQPATPNPTTPSPPAPASQAAPPNTNASTTSAAASSPAAASDLNPGHPGPTAAAGIASASYYHPLGPEADRRLEEEWEALRGSHPEGPRTLQVLFGRTLEARRAAGGAAWFDFEELCGGPLGAADYLAVASSFDTVVLSGVPAMSMQVRDKARRFITLVDELYNARVRLVLAAACPPDQLFGAGGEEEASGLHGEAIIDLEGLQFEGAVDGGGLRRNVTAAAGVAAVGATEAARQETAVLLGGAEERFAFRRAVSRLYEMQAPSYLASRHWATEASGAPAA